MWLEILCLFRCHLGECHDDDFIAHLKKSGGGSVQADTAGFSRPFKNVGFYALAVVVVYYVNMLPGKHAACVH